MFPDSQQNNRCRRPSASPGVFRRQGRSRVPWLELLLLTAACAAVPASRAASQGLPATPDHRDFDMKWSIQVSDVPAGTRMARVWIAVPQELPQQKVKDLAVQTNLPWKFVEDPDFHNRVVEVTVNEPASSFQIDLAAQVRRYAVTGPVPGKLDEARRRLYLRQEALVSLSPRIHALADSIGGDSRTRYNYVLQLMTYDKTTPGWGRGDSERACDVHKGNCTDYHSLFMSLSRAEGVPVYFEMGYPTTPSGEVNRVGGYHCWAWFYDDARRAWSPVDISEADQHPEKTEFFFGHLDADRVAFSRGRDVRLPDMQGPPLNYLPSGAYVEVDGRPLDSVTRSLTYDLASARETGKKQ
jgi:hypothetical protein